MTGVATGRTGRRGRLLVTALAATVLVATALIGTASSAQATQQQTATVRVATLPIANALPMDLGIRKGFFQAEGHRDQQDDAAERQRRRPRGREQERRHRLPRLRPDDDRAHAGDSVHRCRRERGRGHDERRQLAEHPRQGRQLDPWAGRPPRQDGRRERAQGRRRGDDPGGAAEARRRPELRQPARTAVPGDALGLEQRPGRRGLDARAVPLADPERRRPHGDGSRPRARTVLAHRRLRRAERVDHGATRPSRRASGGRSTARSRTRRRTRTRSATCCPAASRNVRLPIWSPLVDREKLVQLARYTKQYGVISNLPNLAAMVPSTVTGGKNLQGTVGNRFIALRLDGVGLTTVAGRPLHVRRQRHVEDPELPAHRARREQVDERQRRRAGDVDGDAQEGHVHDQLGGHAEAAGGRCASRKAVRGGAPRAPLPPTARSARRGDLDVEQQRRRPGRERRHEPRRAPRRARRASRCGAPRSRSRVRGRRC